MKRKEGAPSQQKFHHEIDALSTVIASFLESNKLPLEELIRILKEKQKQKTPLMIPSSILRERKLGIMEAVVKYLKEEFHLTYHQVAVFLRRDDRVIWATYNNALRKHKEKLQPSEPNVWIPLPVFSDPEKGPLEAVSIYLKDSSSMSFKQIGDLLSRDNRVIWTVYNKRKKLRK